MTARRDVLFWGCLGTLVFASRLCHVNVLWADEDYHLAAAIQVLHGKLPYRDFWYDKPPLNLLFYLLFGARTGVALRVADALFVGLCCALAHQLAAGLWSKREGYLAASLLAFFLIFYLIPGVLPLEPDTLVLAPHFAAVFLARKRRPLLAGLCAGLAFQLNVKGAFLLAFAALSGDLFALLIGFLIPSLIVCVWLAVTGALPDYWTQVWKWGWLYASNGWAVRAGALSLFGWFGFHAALLIGAIFIWMRERSRLVLWFVLALAFTLVGLRPAPRYFNLLLPPLIIAAAGGWASAHSHSRRSPVAYRSEQPSGAGLRRALGYWRVRAGLQPALPFLLLLCLLVPIVRFGPRYLYPRSSADTAMDRESRAAAGRITAAAKPGDTIFIWGYRPDIVAYTRLPVAGQIWDSQPLTAVPADRHLSDSRPVDEAWAAQNRVGLTRTRPVFLADGLSQYNPRLDIHRYPELAGWLSRYCEIGRDGGTVLYHLCAD